MTNKAKDRRDQTLSDTAGLIGELSGDLTQTQAIVFGRFNKIGVLKSSVAREKLIQEQCRIGEAEIVRAGFQNGHVEPFGPEGSVDVTCFPLHYKRVKRSSEVVSE